MSLISAAVRLAEEAPAEGHSEVSPYLFGAFGFGVLVVLLIITMMLKVER
jgi:hypothetical protein